MPTHKLALLFIFLFLITFSVPAFAYYDIIVQADAKVLSVTPDQPYGTATSIAAGATANTTLAFDMSSVPYGETITGAWLYVEGSGYYVNNITAYNTTYFNELNVTYNTQPVDSVYQSWALANLTFNISVTDAAIHSHTNNETLYLKLAGNWSPTHVNYLSRESGGGHEPMLRVYTASGSGCNASTDHEVGTVCYNATMYYNNDGCEETYSFCNAGLNCVQMTPYLNATNDLVQNLTDCRVRLGGAFAPNSLLVPCINVCYGGVVRYSTCYADECKECGDATGGFTINSVYDHYTNTYTSDSGTISVQDWTIACTNLTNAEVAYVVDRNGVNTTVVGLLQEAGNNVTLVNDTGTGEGTPTDSGTSGLRDWLNAGMGTNFGSDIISLIISAVISIFVFINVEEKNGSLLFGTFLLCAGACAFIGLLTPWFLVLEGALIFLLVFWKTQGG